MGRYSPTVLPSGESPLAAVIDQFSEGYGRSRERGRRRDLEDEERRRRAAQDERQTANDARLNEIFEMEYPEVGQPAAAARPTMESQIPAGLEGLGGLFEQGPAGFVEGGPRGNRDVFSERPGLGGGDDDLSQLFGGMRGQGMPPRLPKPALPGAFVPGVGFNLAPAGASIFGRSMRVPRRELVAQQQQEEGRAREEGERSELEEVLAALEHISPEQARALARGGPASAVMPPERKPPQSRETDRGIEEFVDGAWKPTGRRPYERPRQEGSEPLVQVQMEDGSIVYKPRSEAAGMNAPKRTGTPSDVGRKRQYDRAVNSLKQQFNSRWNAAYDEEEKAVIQREFNEARANLAAEYSDVAAPWQPGSARGQQPAKAGGGGSDESRARARAQALQAAGKSREEILNTLRAEGFNVR